MGVLKSCQPRQEVLKGDLDDSIFGAEFGDLIAGRAPKVYGDAATFFLNTHPAQQLCKVVQAVFERLARGKEGGTAVRLSTGFGGGKTHTLMALWHLAHNIQDASIGTELLPAAGRPKEVQVVAIDAWKAGVPVFATHGKTVVHSLWGELFYQIGKEKALKALGDADDPESSPSGDQIEAILPNKGALLILLDELVMYLARLSDRGQGNLLGFMATLASIVRSRPQTVLVVTDTKAQKAYAGESAQIGEALRGKLDDVLSKLVSDFDPVGDEAAKVITRRLFEAIDSTASQVTSATYHALYKRLIDETPGTIPPNAAGAEYAKRIVDCYPFHPRLIDTAQDRLGAMEKFQKSRGVLRLFARILRDVWEAKEDVGLITAGEINWSSSRIQADLLQRLDRDPFKAAISADVEKHAGELDGGATRGLHRRVASAILLESLPLESNSGLEPQDLTLAVLRPDEAGHEPAEGLDRLIGTCWHTYPMLGGNGWQFRYQPNVRKQIEERMGKVPLDDARDLVYATAQGYFSGPSFDVKSWPQSASQVSEAARLQLVLCHDEKLAVQICAHSDDSDPNAPIPRGFVNAILAVTTTPSALSEAIERAQRLSAARAIDKDHKTGEGGKLVTEQLKRLLPELEKSFRTQTFRAFDRVVLATGKVYTIDEKYQVPDDQVMQAPKGQQNLRTFLNDKKLIYQADDALDVDRFVNDVLPGATPVPEAPSVYTAKAIHERFLAAPGLRLVPDGGVVRKTLLQALQKGRLVLRLGNGDAYDDQGYVTGPEGKRRRILGESPASLPLDDTVLVTRPDTEQGVTWLKEDAAKKKKDEKKDDPEPPPPPEPTEKVVTLPNDLVETAALRPLLRLALTAKTPADAKGLIGLAQPLGADALSLSVSVGGQLKDGGSVNFAMNQVKPGHAAKPLEIAEKLFNAIGEAPTYETQLALGFGTGRDGMDGAMGQLSDNLPDHVAVKATFGKPQATAS